MLDSQSISDLRDLIKAISDWSMTRVIKICWDSR